MDGRTARSAWSAELRDAFVALLRETGNARASARTLGHRDLFNNRMRRDPVFRRACREAGAQASARFEGAESAFPEASRGCSTQALPPAGGEQIADLGGYLKPGRKRRPERPEPVIRRTSNGRVQVTFARDGHWTSEIEADFLARLRATGNFKRSALAVGFQPASVIDRTRKWAAFKRAVDEAIEEASATLDYALVAHAHALLRTAASTAPSAVEVGERPSTALGTSDGNDDDVPFDPDKAMRIIGFIDRRRAGRTGGRGRKGPPERTFQDAVKSILGKIEAIERHEQMMQARGQSETDPSRHSRESSNPD